MDPYTGHHPAPRQHHDDGDGLLTLAETADQLRTPVATLRYWRHLGVGPRSFKLGRRVMYRRRDVDTWVERQHGSGCGGLT